MEAGNAGDSTINFPLIVTSPPVMELIPEDELLSVFCVNILDENSLR